MHDHGTSDELPGDASGQTTPVRDLWFRRTPRGIRPTDWRGRAALAAYIFLSLTALVTYSNLGLTALVVLVYTGLFFFLLLVRSDLFDDALSHRR